MFKPNQLEMYSLFKSTYESSVLYCNARKHYNIIFIKILNLFKYV